jgi:hypothetical protein
VDWARQGFRLIIRQALLAGAAIFTLSFPLAVAAFAFEGGGDLV